MDNKRVAQSLVVVGRYAPTDQPGIHLFHFNPTTGELTPAGEHAGIANPSFLIIHPNRRWLYATSESAPGAVWALRLENEPLTLRPLNRQPSGGDAPCHLQLDATGRWLLASNYSSGTVAVLPLLSDGSLGEMTDRAQHHGRGPHPERQDGPHAHSAVFSPDNRFAIVADLGIDQLVVYAFEAAGGRLHPHSQAKTEPGAGPRHMAFHPDGRTLYVANELNSTVTVYDYADGALRARQTLSTLPPDAPQGIENIVAHILVSPDGRRVYVSNRGHNSITLFEVSADRRLSHRATAPCGGDWPRHFSLIADRFLLVANQYSGDVAVLPLGDSPEPVGVSISKTAVPNTSCVQFLPADE
jgi:6-phosphogluconolactonase